MADASGGCWIQTLCNEGIKLVAARRDGKYNFVILWIVKGTGGLIFANHLIDWLDD
jgi:hypothetical protein